MDENQHRQTINTDSLRFQTLKLQDIDFNVTKFTMNKEIKERSNYEK